MGRETAIASERKRNLVMHGYIGEKKHLHHKQERGGRRKTGAGPQRAGREGEREIT